MKPWIWASSILLASGAVTMGVYATRSLPAPASSLDAPAAGAEIASANLNGRAPRDREFAIHLDAAPSSIIGPLGRALDVWSYNATVPGPTIRVRVGQPLRVEVSNHLSQPDLLVPLAPTANSSVCSRGTGSPSMSRSGAIP